MAKLKLSSKKYINPEILLKNLVNSMGEKIEYGDEKDLQETHINIIERRVKSVWSKDKCVLYSYVALSHSREITNPINSQIMCSLVLYS